MFRVITLNVNGLRSALAKGLLTWLARQRADVVCLQEIRLGRQGVPVNMNNSHWHGYYYPAQTPGYSGTAVLSRTAAKDIQYGFGVDEFDQEGRFLLADFGDICVASLYAPSGSSGEHRQASKNRFLDTFESYCQDLLRRRRRLLICGDINIAHTRKDLRNWSSNQKNSGFLPHERALMDRWLQKPGSSKGSRHWCDVFRLLNDQESQYTWWSNRGRAWENNVGWRIDYHIATDDLAHCAYREKIYKDKRFSDHSPLIIDYEFEPKKQPKKSTRARSSLASSQHRG